MKRDAILLLVSIDSIGASWAAFQALGPEAPPLSRYVPAGSLLYLQAKDFSALLGDWNASPQKASWVKSKNYEVYSRSRLFLRLQGASQQFAAAAGLPADMNFLTQVAGTQSAFALYDIGKLEFLYIEKIVPSPYFRSYWIQRNIPDMKQYNAAVSDLFRSGGEYREERVLLKKSATAADATTSDGATAVADLLRIVPADTGTYEVRAIPSAADCLDGLETKILAPHRCPAVAQQTARNVQLSPGATVSSSASETRIDQAPLKTSASSDASTPLKDLFQKAQVRAILQVQNTERDKDGVFVRIHSGVAFLAAPDCPQPSVLSPLFALFRPSLPVTNLRCLRL